MNCQLQIEYDELQQKLQNLRAFLDDVDETTQIGPYQLELLQAQEIAMDQYADILFERLNYNG